ncbi:MAG: response regulator [Oligoflexia bacterium]|nr:response regulator [Oligoflexia bacterium]
MAGYSDLRFLVVDDMLTMRKIITQQLRNLGVTLITEANDGTVAWDTLEKSASAGAPMNFIVSDWNMPEMKGIDLLKKCRASTNYKDVAFLLVTAEAEATQVKEAILAGVDNYVIKPFTPQAFQEKLGAIFAKRFGAK